MVFIKQFCAVFRLFFFGLMCLFYNYAVIAGQTSELDEKLLKAISHNNLAEVQRFVAEGASTEVSNASGLSAIDIAVDNGFYDIAHFLIAIQKENPQAKRDTSNKQFFNLPPPL